MLTHAVASWEALACHYKARCLASGKLAERSLGNEREGKLRVGIR